MKKTLSKKARQKREAYIEWLTNIMGESYDRAIWQANLYDWN